MKRQIMLVSPFKSIASNLYPRPWSGVVLGALRGTVVLDKLTVLRRGPMVTLGSRATLFNRVVKVPHVDRKAKEPLCLQTASKMDMSSLKDGTKVGMFPKRRDFTLIQKSFLCKRRWNKPEVGVSNQIFSSPVVLCQCLCTHATGKTALPQIHTCTKLQLPFSTSWKKKPSNDPVVPDQINLLQGISHTSLACC